MGASIDSLLPGRMLHYFFLSYKRLPGPHRPCARFHQSGMYRSGGDCIDPKSCSEVAHLKLLQKLQCNLRLARTTHPHHGDPPCLTRQGCDSITLLQERFQRFISADKGFCFMYLLLPIEVRRLSEFVGTCD